jgi:hypothetical protein
MVKRAIDIVEHNDFTVLYDKGYHTGSEIAACHRMGIETLVAVPSRPVTSMAPDPAFNVEAFTYNPQTDSYICPAGQTLTYLRGGRNIHRYLRSQQCKLRPSRWSSNT